MNIKIVMVLLGIPLLLAGCKPYTPFNVTMPAITSEHLSITPEKTATSEYTPPMDSNWIMPGKVNISNYYAGANAEYPITIHNGNADITSFVVSYRIPNRVGDGYIKAPSQAGEWVIISEPKVDIVGKGDKDVLITLAMPKDTESLPDCEFWISVIAQGQGMVETELISRWLVDMR